MPANERRTNETKSCRQRLILTPSNMTFVSTVSGATIFRQQSKSRGQRSKVCPGKSTWSVLSKTLPKLAAILPLMSFDARWRCRLCHVNSAPALLSRIQHCEDTSDGPISVRRKICFGRASGAEVCLDLEDIVFEKRAALVCEIVRTRRNTTVAQHSSWRPRHHRHGIKSSKATNFQASEHADMVPLLGDFMQKALDSL